MANSENVELSDFSDLDQVDIICDRYEQEWLSGSQPDVCDYLEPTVDRNELLRELLGLEIEYRERQGDQVSLAELQTRFPEDTVLVAEVLSTSDSAVARYKLQLPITIDDFELRSELGAGSFGAVYLARDHKLDRDVAIKIANRSASSDIFARMVQEAKSVAQLRHPGIVPVFQVGECEYGPYIVMEYVEGQTLKDYLAKQSSPGFRQSAQLIACIAESVHLAHTHGIIHRDLKPGNIMVGSELLPDVDQIKESTARVLDFGLARHMQSDEEITREDQVLGTPAYMSPEQAFGRHVDRTTDIYSLGVILYELLTGQRPHMGGVQTLIRKVTHDDLVAPKKINSGLPADLNTICLKALERSTADRYATAQQLADDLKRWLDHKPIHAKQSSRFVQLARWAQRKRGLVMSMAVAAALILTALFLANQIIKSNRTAQVEQTVQNFMEARPDLILKNMSAVRESPEALQLVSQQLVADKLEPREACLACIALLPSDHRLFLDRIESLQQLSNDECQFVAESLPSDAKIAPALWRNIAAESADSNWVVRASILLANLDPTNPNWALNYDKIAVAISCQPMSQYQTILKCLQPVEETAFNLLVGRLLRDSINLNRVQMLSAILSGKKDISQLVPIVASLEKDEFELVVQALSEQPELAKKLVLKELKSHEDLSTIPQTEQRVRLLMSLLALQTGESFSKAAKTVFSRDLQTLLVHWPYDNGFKADAIVKQLGAEADFDLLYALILCVSRYAETKSEATGQKIRAAIKPLLTQLYEHHRDPGVHSAAFYALRRWGLDADIRQIDKRLVERGLTKEHDWYLNHLGQCMAIVKLDYSDYEDENENRYLAIATTETTVGHFKQFWESYRANLEANDETPASGVNWFDALRFCDWLTTFENDLEPAIQVVHTPAFKIRGGQTVECQFDLRRTGYRLPSVLEFQQCHSARSDLDCFFGNAKARFLKSYTGEIFFGQDGPLLDVGTTMPNPFGLHDMIANVSEWTLSVEGDEIYAAERQTPGVVELENRNMGLKMLYAVANAGNTRNANNMASISQRKSLYANPVFGNAYTGFRICRTVYRNP